jgi:predicted CoA-binding protein
VVLTTASDVRDLLARARTIAVVGLSGDPARDSHSVAAYLQAHGYRIIGVNPNEDRVLGETSYESLESIPEDLRRQVDIVDVFRRPEAALEVARSAGRLRLKAIWFQLGVATPEAVAEADRAGLSVVEGSCIKTAHQLLRPGEKVR